MRITGHRTIQGVFQDHSDIYRIKKEKVKVLSHIIEIAKVYSSLIQVRQVINAVFTFKPLLRFKLIEVKLTELSRLVQCLYWLK